MFDPYRDWLDIPPEHQPPTHYRLLGIAADEADQDAIKEAALEQTTRVRMYQSGPQAEVCTRILNEIARARAVLVNPKTRQEYDARLAAAMSAPARPVSAAPIARATSVQRSPRPWPRPERVIVAVAYGCLLLFGFGISFCLSFRYLPPAAHRAAQEGAAEEEAPTKPEDGPR